MLDTQPYSRLSNNLGGAKSVRGPAAAEYGSVSVAEQDSAY